MTVLKALTACFSTYSRIPMPHVELDSKDMKYALIFFPFIGGIIGILEYCLYALVEYYSLPKMFFVLLAAAIPLIITGGIHVDGYMDTTDALNSYGDMEKKLQIMKDPHNGGFAVIKLAVYGLLYMAFLYLINNKSIFMFAISFAVSRTFSGISVCTINGAKKTGMLNSLKENTFEKTVLAFLVAFGIAEGTVLIINNIIFGIASVVAIGAYYFIYKKMCIKNFGGITGDTSGFYLCIMELMLLIISAVGGLL